MGLTGEKRNALKGVGDMTEVLGELAQQAVTVGFDGSAPARTALQWAAFEAATRGATLTVTSVAEPTRNSPGTATSPGQSEGAPSDAESAARQAAAAVQGLVDVRAETRQGTAREILASSSAQASLLVVGSSGHVGIGGWLRGSVSRYLIHHCSCPLVVVGPHCYAGPVRRLVLSPTLDPDGASFDVAAAWLEHARVPVHVLGSFAMAALIPDIALAEGPDAVREAAQARNALYIERLRSRLPSGTTITGDVEQGRPIEVLDRQTRVGDVVILPRGCEHDAPISHGGSVVCLV
jgi:nucleotide-binding universal stress UspA family protein